MGGDSEVQERRDRCILWLIHVDVWQKSNQYCKAIILQLKMNNFFKLLIPLQLAAVSFAQQRM